MRSAPRHLLGTAAATVTTTSTNDTDKSDINTNNNDKFATARFDTNMVVILAALLCALIFALGLNSIIRCVLRFTRQRRGLIISDTTTTTTTGAASNNNIGGGLKKSALRKIPVAVYGSNRTADEDDDDNNNSNNNVPEMKEDECPICLGEFVGGDKVRVLPECNHGFHVTCIDTWLLSHSSCPNCRHSVLVMESSSETATGQVVVAVADQRV